jgi:hypothetical protein
MMKAAKAHKEGAPSASPPVLPPRTQSPPVAAGREATVKKVSPPASPNERDHWWVWIAGAILILGSVIGIAIRRSMRR